jgi:hypothetical protein
VFPILIAAVGVGWLLYSRPTTLAWIAAIYLACGALTMLAVALIVRNARASGPVKSPWSDVFRSMFLVLALWPAVVVWGVVIALIMIGQRRRNAQAPHDGDADGRSRD